MGMFDRLYIDTNILPISEEEKLKLGKNPEWQTKSLDCELTEVYITDNGELKVNKFVYDVVEKKDRPYPNKDGILGLAGSLKRVNERLVTVKHDGIVNFYTDVENEWFEFNAHFIDGILIYIKKHENR